MVAMPFSEPFDFVVAMTSLEFCHNKRQALREVGRLLRSSGQVYLEVRNAGFLLFRVLGPLIQQLTRWKWIVPYEAEGFRDLSFSEWHALIAEAGFRIVRLERSMRPAQYGGVVTRIKNLLIKLVAHTVPLRWHYMVGFVCAKGPSSAADA
jgi:SAM-dependent methyltransferase